MKTILAVSLVACFALAGCSGDDASTVVQVKKDLAPNKGGVLGLLIDDIYRPISGGEIFLLPLGLKTTTDKSGQFQYTDLDPGSYQLKVSSVGHEGAPINVDVTANEYKEVEFPARRVSSDDGRILTAQYSAFVPCAADFVANGVVANCLGDLSGDSYRPGFTTDSSALGDNVTYLVTEAKISQKGDWTIQVRHDNGDSAGGERYAVGNIKQGTYIKFVNQYNVSNTEHNEQDNNVPWKNNKPYATIMFYNGAMKEEISGSGVPLLCCGVGAAFAFKGTFVQSLFIGPPIEDVATYAVMKEDQ